jgi:hypothetical protein
MIGQDYKFWPIIFLSTARARRVNTV